VKPIWEYLDHLPIWILMLAFFLPVVLLGVVEKIYKDD